MAKRLVFYVNKQNKYVREEIEFKWYPGFAKTQVRKSIKALQESFLIKHPNQKVLEISSSSPNLFAEKASAFNLKVMTSHGVYTVEQLFQAGKVFKIHGSQINLLDYTSKKAKKANKLLNQTDQLVGFEIFGAHFPLEPKTYFYNWIYLKALQQNPKIAKKIVQYDAFTDIYFNNVKSYSCQAEAASIYVSLLRRGILSKALANCKNFRKMIYST